MLEKQRLKINILDLFDMPLLEDDEKVKSVAEKTIAERGKLNPRKKPVAGIKILTPNKLLTIILVLLAQIKARKGLYKLKYKIKLILCIMYQHSKITKKF